MISKEEALQLLDEHVSEKNLKKHMLAVSAIMKGLARRLGKDEERWELTGLLHDIDYDQTKNNVERHGLLSAEILGGKLPEDCLHAIKAHSPYSGVEMKGVIDKALIAADAMSGLAVAAALVMPHKKLSEVRVSTLEDKFKDKSFARRVSRERIKVCREIGLELREFFELALQSLQQISEKLGL